MISRDAVERSGGKGASLIRLRDAGLPVPPFVIVDTSEYTAFVRAAGLEPTILSALRDEPAKASEAIRAAFGSASLDAAQRARLLALVEPLLDTPVAVRSSATIEDLPGLSAAGQQDSFLDVRTADAVLARIVRCWSSLWTERAIAYRRRNGVGDDVRIAVVVQQMVPAEASGVLFTANPRTGRRDEVVVESVPGLGEALVSGQVTPDSFVLDAASGAVRAEERAGAEATLSSTQLAGLLDLARRIQQLYAQPMDVEWARVGEALSVVQARPITGLYPLPAPNPEPHPRPEVWFSFGAFQGLLEPITPLGQDMIRMTLSGAARIAGRRVPWRSNRFVTPAGERLWLRVDGLLRVRATRNALLRFLPFAEPTVAAILSGLSEEPDLRATRTVPSASAAAGVLRFAARTGPRVRAALAHPAQARRSLDRTCEQLVANIAEAMASASDLPTPQQRLDGRVQAMELAGRTVLATLLPVFAPIMGPSMVLLSKLREAAAATGLEGADALATNVMRSLPGNVTTAMDIALADAATTIRSDATAWGWVAETPASELTRLYRAGNLPQVAQTTIDAFLAEYGMRGVAEIDLGARRWRDDPTPVMHTLKSYLDLPPDAQPRARHEAGQHEAGRSVRALMDASPRARADKIRGWARTIRALAGARETPKFTIVRVFGLLREGLDASAAELVAQGRLETVADLAFLTVDELPRAFSEDWHEVVAVRRGRHEAELRRTQVPRVLVEDGRTFYDGVSHGSGDLNGVGVSPGVAEGPVRVVHDPRTTALRHGEIMVCRGTDPAWTPLFLTAGGLVTEVGGLMTHGSVVAREYGLPAVVGVHEATTRLTDGQHIRLDGASGAIEFLDDPA